MRCTVRHRDRLRHRVRKDSARTDAPRDCARSSADQSGGEREANHERRGQTDGAGSLQLGRHHVYVEGGEEQHFPRTDEEWEALQDSAATLAEAGNLLLLGSRTVDKADWTRLSKAMTDAATLALKAAQAKDKQRVFDSGEAIYNTCNECHQKYQRAS